MSEESIARAAHVLALAEALLGATEAMEKEDWLVCERLCYNGARHSRLILMADRQSAKDKENAD